MKRLIISVGIASFVALSLSACSSRVNGIKNSPPDRTVSQPRRGSY